MRSTFYGLDIANKGLFIAQRQVDLTAHNVSNANTDGYTRQRITSAAVDPVGMFSKFIPSDSANVGGGVRSMSIDQIRDKFLDRQYRNEYTKASYWETRYNTLYYVEDVFNNLDTSNLNDLMSGFFNSLQEISVNSTDAAVRKEVTEKALSLTETFHSYYGSLTDLMTQQNEMLKGSADRVNAISQQVSELNAAIFKYELSGNPANDLRDKRNLLLDELSGITAVSYKETGTGKTDLNGKEMFTFQVTIGGETLVDHNSYRALEAVRDATNDVLDAMDPPPTGEDLLYTIRFADTGDAVNISGGTMKAFIDMRDGNTTDTQGIPYLISELNKLVKAVVTEFNAVHQTGWTMPYTDEAGVYHESTNGINFFDPNGLTLDTMGLSAEIKNSVFNVAASGEKVTMDSNLHLETGNNDMAKALAKLYGAATVPVIGNFEKFYNTFITGLASEVKFASDMTDQEFALCDGLDSQRVSMMGVSIDEEMSSLVRFQHAYNAAARVLTAMDEDLDVLINRTGRVGL